MRKSLRGFPRSLTLSGPLQLRVQSRSRTQWRIAASIAFLFCACFKRFFSLENEKFNFFLGSDLLSRMLCTFCPPAIWTTSLGLCGNRPESSADKCTEHASKKIRPSKRLELCIFQSFRDYNSTTIARLSPPKRFRTRRSPSCVWMRDRAR